jgi:hypothetical protein
VPKNVKLVQATNRSLDSLAKGAKKVNKAVDEKVAANKDGGAEEPASEGVVYVVCPCPCALGFDCNCICVHSTLAWGGPQSPPLTGFLAVSREECGRSSGRRSLRRSSCDGKSRGRVKRKLVSIRTRMRTRLQLLGLKAARKAQGLYLYPWGCRPGTVLSVTGGVVAASRMPTGIRATLYVDWLGGPRSLL